MIAIGCDHGGFVLKQEIMKFLESAGYEYEDFGTYSETAREFNVSSTCIRKYINDIRHKLI